MFLKTEAVLQMKHIDGSRILKSKGWSVIRPNTPHPRPPPNSFSFTISAFRCYKSLFCSDLWNKIICIAFSPTAANGLCNAADAGPLAVPLWGICSRDGEILEQSRSEVLKTKLSLHISLPGHNNPVLNGDRCHGAPSARHGDGEERGGIVFRDKVTADRWPKNGPHVLFLLMQRPEVCNQPASFCASVMASFGCYIPETLCSECVSGEQSRPENKCKLPEFTLVFCISTQDEGIYSSLQQGIIFTYLRNLHTTHQPTVFIRNGARHFQVSVECKCED